MQPTPEPPQIPLPVTDNVVEKEVIKEVPVEVIKEIVKEVPVVNQEEVDKQIQQKITEEQTVRRQRANQARKQRRDDNLNKMMEYVGRKGSITNEDTRDLLHVSQSTATDYLSDLVKLGMVKVDKKAKATVYTRG